MRDAVRPASLSFLSISSSPSLSLPLSLLTLSLLLPQVTSLNVLVFVPTLSYSHVAFNGRIADELLDRGHKVVMLLPVVDDNVHFNGSSRAEVLRVAVGVPPSLLSRTLWHNPGPYEDSSPLNPRILVKLIRVSSIFVRACDQLASNTHLLHHLKQYSFDVGIVEQYDGCGFGLFSALGIRSSVWISATAVFRLQPEALGVNYPLSYVPELFAHVDDRMSLLGKLENILIATVTELTSSFFTRAEESKIFRRKGVLPRDQDLLQVSRRSHSILLNAMPLFDFPMPLSSQIGHVAGITVDMRHRQLERRWERIVESSVDGFILVTFGSIAKTREMPSSMSTSFHEAFAAFPNITFIVKHEDVPRGSVRSMAHNVFVSSWLPQMALMGHSKFRAIVTHGGWSSILESIYHGRPLILMPLFADHAKNSQVVRAKRVGVLIDKMAVTAEGLIHAIREITLNPEYASNCRRFSSMLQSASPISHGDLLDYHVRRAAKTSDGRSASYSLPREASLPLPLVKGMDLLCLVLSLVLALSW